MFSWITLNALFLLGCASRLPRERHVHPPVFQGDLTSAKLDLDGVMFTDLKSRQAVSLGVFMKDAGIDSLLLNFGSKNCAACNLKAKALTRDVIGKHPIYLTEPGRRFMVVGVNTDPSPERLGAYTNEYPFILWSDPGGKEMVARFAPPGSRFRVPLTVMVHRSGIAWRVLPDDHTTVTEMMQRVALTLGLSNLGSAMEPGSQSAEQGQGPRTGEPPNPTITPSLLSEARPNRLEGLEVLGCDGKKTFLHQVLADADLKFVQVIRGGCQGTCQESLATLRELPSRCQKAGLALCAAVTLEAGLGPDSLPGSACAKGPMEGVYRGGEEFLNVFASHFDWRYPRDLDQGGLPYLTRRVDGPIVLGFSKDGTLIFSREGSIRTEDLMQAVMARDPLKHARGPDFPMFNAARGFFSFADWRFAAQYTVVMGWSTICTSCDAQLKHWSEPGQLVDFCTAHQGFCQVGAVENVYPGEGGALASYFETLMTGIIDSSGQPSYDGFHKLGIRVPLILDPVADGPGPMDYLGRLHDGYMLAASRDVPPEHMNDFRTFIYDQEGKIVARFYGEVLESGKDDPILAKLKRLLLDQQSH
jgi:hypothetical protein